MSFMIKDVDFVPGDIIRVHERIKEGDKSRIQIFEGTVLALKGRGENQSFTVMKIVGDIGVEKIFPIKSPNVEKVEKTKDGEVLAFVEVKTRTSSLFGSPLESITSWKLRFLIRTAQYYKMTHKN